MPFIASRAGGSARGFGFAGKKGLGPYTLLSTINSSGNYTVPNSVSKLTVIIRGAGNSGGAGAVSENYRAGGAGSGGQGGSIIIANEVPVTAGSTYAVTIGTAGNPTNFGTNLVQMASGTQNTATITNAALNFYGAGGTSGAGGGAAGNLYQIGPAGGAGGAGGNGANAVPTGYVSTGLPTVQASGGGGGGGGGGSFSGPGGNGAGGAGGSLYGANAASPNAADNSGGGGGGGYGGNRGNGYYMGNNGSPGGTGGSAQILIYGAE